MTQGLRVGFALVLAATVPKVATTQAPVALLNVSYDATRELFTDVNPAFARYWKSKTGLNVTVRQSHGGSSAQARAVMDGLEADVVSLGLAVDIDQISARSGLVPADWQSLLPHHSAPYTSTVLFLVRGGNPKHIRDWDDLVRPDISVITPNPKTSGGARLNYLAAWGYALRQHGGSDSSARAFVARLYHNVPVLDAGARGAMTTFAERGLGDVLITWESEALLAQKELEPGSVAVVMPSVSVLAEPPVAVVEKVAERHGTLAVAQGYLEYLYTEEGQDIGARNYFRPRSQIVTKKYARQFAGVALFTVDQVFGGWQRAQAAHFADGGVFDQLYRPAEVARP